MYIPFALPISSRDIFVFFVACLLITGAMLLLTKDDKSGAGIRHLNIGFFVCSIVILTLLVATQWRI
jgi:hypothetical protein